MKGRSYRIRWAGPDGVSVDHIDAPYQGAAVERLRERETVHEVLQVLPQGQTPEDAGKALWGEYEREL